MINHYQLLAHEESSFSSSGHLNASQINYYFHCQIHLLPEESPTHHQVRPRTDMIQTLTNLLQGYAQKQDEALILTNRHPGGGHTVERTRMKICHHLVGLATHR